MTEQNLRDIYYCTPAEIKAMTGIEQDVTDDKIKLAQQHAESLDINPIIGTDLMLSLKQELWDNAVSGTTLTEATQNLLTHIKFAEAFSVWAFIIPMIHYKTTRGGIMLMSPGNANAGDEDNVKSLIQKVDGIKFGYKDQLKKFLDCNKSLYPDYQKESNFFTKHNDSGILFY